MVTNRRLIDVDMEDINKSDFFPTPTWATEALLKQEDFDGNILEPCCGDGAISKVFNDWGFETISSDKYDRGFGEVRDAFEIKTRYPNIVTNPPFAIAEELVHHFSDKFYGKMCLLLRTAFLEGATRYFSIYAKNPPNRVHVFTERVSMYPSGFKGKKKGGTTSYAWFVWDHERKNEGTEVLWIPPGLKPRSRYAKSRQA